MISVVIRNKNEAIALESILNILQKIYIDDIDEIIVVDNKSTDESILVAEKFKCKIITIENFTYGKAINLGIKNAKNDLILLLSSHAVPIGMSFFKNTIIAVNKEEKSAGARFINSIENYKRALNNDFLVKDGLNFGLMAACAIVNKKVWETYPFDEKLIASEDKEWSDRVLKAGFKILDINETFFYFANRNDKEKLKRWEIETIAHYQLHKLKYPSIFKIALNFIKKMTFNLPKEYLKKMKFEFLSLIVKLKISNSLRKKKL